MTARPRIKEAKDVRVWTTKEAVMPIEPHAIGTKTDPHLFEWTDRDTMLYALGVGAGAADLALTTENNHDTAQQVLPTYAVIACSAFGAGELIGSFNPAMLLHGSQAIRLFAPIAAAGRLSVVCEVVDIQDKGPGKHAVVMLKGVGADPETSQIIAETLTTVVIRGEGGFGGYPGHPRPSPKIPDRQPDWQIALPTQDDQALLYRLSGDRNPLHSDPWFARELAGFPRPILHGLCTYGFAGRALVYGPGGGDTSRISAIAARFSSPVFPGDTLTTTIWRTGSGRVVFRVEASNDDELQARVVLDDGIAQYS
jgi:acyl dehydratase